MGWAFIALMIVGGICAGILEMQESSEHHDTPLDDEFTHQEGDDDYGE